VTLRVALVGGPMYDPLYEVLGRGGQAGTDVDVVVHADHPTLNREVAARLSAGERLDVISTHSKYAPSQRHWLTPLDDLVPAEVLAPLDPAAVRLCRFRDELLSVPRNVDVRVLWWRADRMETPPASWGQLVDSGLPFGFPGRESGLFGTFFEIVVGNGGDLFEGARPTMVSPESEEAVELLCRLAARAPADLPEWHYDQVDAALLAGRVDAAAAWPGGYGSIRDSALADHLRPAPYPAGRRRWVSYSGVHSWAIPRSCDDVPAAVALIERLASAEAAGRDAAGGSVPAHRAAAIAGPASGQAGSAGAGQDPVDVERLEITGRTIAEAMITYPPLERFPAIEDAGWAAINAALRGQCGASEAVRRVQRAAEEALA
jgi:multiple sugar transport system substrate-binding protein